MANEVRAGRAFVELSLKDNRFKRAFDAVSKRTKAGLVTMTKAAATAGVALVGAGTAIGAALAGAGSHFAKVGDTLDKMSARTGMSAESLSALGFAAEQSGSSLEALGPALLRMNRRLGRITAGLGSGSQVAALEALGLDAATLQTLTAEERFFAIADAMASMSDQAEAAGLAQRAFGTAVDGVLPLLLQGSDGIKQLTRQASDLGLVVDQETAAKAAKLTDALNILKRVAHDIVFELGSAVAPLMTDLAQRATELAKRVADFVEDNGGVALASADVIQAGLELAYEQAKNAILNILDEITTGLALHLEEAGKLIDQFARNAGGFGIGVAQTAANLAAAAGVPGADTLAAGLDVANRTAAAVNSVLDNHDNGSGSRIAAGLVSRQEARQERLAQAQERLAQVIEEARNNGGAGLGADARMDRFADILDDITDSPELSAATARSIGGFSAAAVSRMFSQGENLDRQMVSELRSINDKLERVRNSDVGSPIRFA